MADIEIKPIENGNYGNNEVMIDDVSVKYVQNTDSSGEDGDEEAQTITISTRNNGVARFINIKTESWSIDSVDELIDIINDFKERARL